MVAAAGAVACFRDGLVQGRDRRRLGGVRPDVQQLSAPALRPPDVLQPGQAGQVLLAAASAAAAAISSASTGSGCMISACHRQLPRSLPAMVTSPRATAATMSCRAGSSTHHSPSSGMTRGPSPVSFFSRKCAPWLTLYSACTASVNSAPPGSPVPVTATNPNSGTSTMSTAPLPTLSSDSQLVAIAVIPIIVATARPTRKEPKVRNQRALMLLVPGPDVAKYRCSSPVAHVMVSQSTRSGCRSALRARCAGTPPRPVTGRPETCSGRARRVGLAKVSVE